ncbi:MAG: TolC family protein [Chitinophagaceae bacterium]
MSISIKLKKVVAPFILLIAAQVTNAQQPFAINLETVLQLAGANNLTVKEYQLRYQQALADQSKAREWWLPNIYAGYTTHYLNGAAMNADGKIFTGVNRDNLWTGLGIAAEIDFGKGFYQSLAARQKAQSASYFIVAEKNRIVLNAIHTYYDLQAAQLQYIFLKQLAEQSDTISQQIKIKVDVGLSYQSDYLLAQSNFRHITISMLQAKSDWSKLSAVLASLLNLESNTRLLSADTVLAPLKLTTELNDTTGFLKRPEYLGLNAELQSYKTSRKTINQGLLIPKLKIGFDNGGFGAYSAQLYNTYQLNASLLWNLPLGRLTYKGDIKQWNAQIALQQNRVAQFQNQYQQETATAAAQVQIANEQITIAKEGLQSASEALYQSTERQKLGTTKPFEVFQVQQYFIQAQLDYINAVSEYNKAQYALFVATGNNL